MKPMKRNISMLVLAISSLLAIASCKTTGERSRAEPPVNEVSDTVRDADSSNSTPVVEEETLVDVNDVSLLFPAPQSTEENEKLLAIGDISSGDGSAVLPNVDFDKIIAVSESDQLRIGDRQIKIPPEIRDMSVWKVAGIRFDPSAPGASADIRESFGSLPQIRLVVQPVTAQARSANIHDVALHLIYDFKDESEGSGNSGLKNRPNTEVVSRIIEDIKGLKNLCRSQGVDTSGPLGVHPCLESGNLEFREAIKSFLSKHLHQRLFNSGALMALNNGQFEPWIFFAFVRGLDSGFSAIPIPSLTTESERNFSQMLSFIDSPNVQPEPRNFNRNGVSSQFFLPSSERKGVSTSELFKGRVMEDFVIIGLDASGRNIVDKTLRNSDIVDWVANPEKSHFFNTDCVSCHSETTLRERKSIPESRFAFQSESGVSGLSEGLVPENEWNVRNFGWFKRRAIATQRTANESAEVVHFVNSGAKF